MAIAKINNIECYYEVHGEGKPLLLIGGLSSDSQTWQLVLSPLKKRFKIIIFDNRGVGRTKDPGEAFDVALMAQDTVMLLDHLGIENADILGHSMGGFIAQDIAITHPERVNKLILANTAAAISDRVKIFIEDLLDIYSSDGQYEFFIREFMKWLFSPVFLSNKKKVEQFMKYVLAYPYRQTPKDFKRQFSACIKFHSVDRLKKIQSETLLLSGEQDRIVSLAEIDLLESLIPNTKTKRLANAAHSIQTEFPKQFVKDVIEFLA